MSLRHCILGLLALRPMSGYSLRSVFDRSVNHVWSGSPSQIYASLRSLELAGLATAERVIQNTRPNKTMYTVTPDGEEELRRWLTSPVPMSFAKDEFLARIFFANEISDDQAAELLEQYARQLEASIAYLEGERKEVLSRPTRRARTRHFRVLSLDLKVAGMRATREAALQAVDELRGARARA